MNAVVFGEDIYTSVAIESLIEKGHNVLLIVTPVYRNENYKVLEETAAKFGIVLVKDVNVNSESIKHCLKKIKPDIVIAVHLRKILDKGIFSLATKAAINVHPSLLPRFRGLSPQHQAILHGDTESGVTVHYIDADVDTGDIIVQKKFPVAEHDYILNVQQKMLAIYKTIVVEALELLQDKDFKPVKQDLSKLSYFGPLKKTDREIDLSKTKCEIYRQVRAVSLPYKGAFYKNCTIWIAEFPDADKESELGKKYKEPGFYVDDKAEQVIIRLKDGFIVSDDFEIN
jgi:methionyl-tRNA formyltransferase